MSVKERGPKEVALFSPSRIRVKYNFCNEVWMGREGRGAYNRKGFSVIRLRGLQPWGEGRGTYNRKGFSVIKLRGLQPWEEGRGEGAYKPDFR